MGSRSMDKLGICLIPFINLLRMTLTILSVLFLLMRPPLTIWRAFRNSSQSTAILILHTTKLYIPIKKILEILSVLLVLYLSMFLVPTPSTIWRTSLNGAKWIVILSIHTIIFAISSLHSLNQIQILHTALHLVMQLSLVQLCLH